MGLPTDMRVTPLGAGCEVGRSCILVEYKDKRVLLDCGLHPAHQGLPSLPLFDTIDLSRIDFCLVTHFHLDHCGALPYLVEHTPFTGKVLMTDATKAISQLVWNDFCMFSRTSQKALFTESDITSTLASVDTLNFFQKYQHAGIEVTPLPAGHVVGACMFHVRFPDDTNVLYTGDFSNENDRHVPCLRIPQSLNVQVLISESTYGVRTHEPRLAREKRFIANVEKIVVDGNGKCLLPIFALGRVQELLFILNEHWENNPSLQSIPIYYISALSRRGIDVMTEYAATYGGTSVRMKALRGENAFDLRHVQCYRNYEDFAAVCDFSLPCVALTAPGMLQSGTSRILFEMWCTDKANGVILTGYTLRGTLGDQLKKNPPSIKTMDGREIPVRSNLEMISFSAHADFEQTKALVDFLKPPIVVLVHGEKTEMHSLQDKLQVIRPNLRVFSPKLLQTLHITFPATSLMTVGQLASNMNAQTSPINCILADPGTGVRTLATVKDTPTSIGMSKYTVAVEWIFVVVDGVIITLSDIKEAVRQAFPSIWLVETPNCLSICSVTITMSSTMSVVVAFHANEMTMSYAKSIAFVILSRFCSADSMKFSDAEFRLLVHGLSSETGYSEPLKNLD